MTVVLNLKLQICLAGEFVAQFKFTLLLMPNGPMKITGLSFDESLFESENSVRDVEMKVTAAFCTVSATFHTARGKLLKMPEFSL